MVVVVVVLRLAGVVGLCGPGALGGSVGGELLLPLLPLLLGVGLRHGSR